MEIINTGYKELIYNINQYINSDNNENCKKIDILIFQNIFQYFENTDYTFILR